MPICVQSGSSVSAFAGGVVKVKELDWLKDNLCTGVCFVCPLALVTPLWHLEFSAL
jgi:hypothetical protein